MNYFKRSALILCAAIGLAACGNSSSTKSVTPDESIRDFAKGADIGWVTEYESKGYNFYNAQGEKRECTALMKELGMDAIRIRVWVDPSAHGNWCNTPDVVEKAKRAKELGMDVMIDFHYSDYWADPAQQYKPAAWAGKSIEELKKAISDHTSSVLLALKTEGISPKWVQIGNEIRPGLLWDENVELSGAAYDVRECDLKNAPADASTKVKYPANWKNIGEFINSGYDAVKSLFGDAIVIVHLDNGWDKELFNWFFDELKSNGGKWDMIGMSIYPYWTQLEHKEYRADDIITDCIENINELSNKYDCDVMIVEAGVECGDDYGKLVSKELLQEGKRQLDRIIKESRENTNGRCKGVFYWEPECKPSQYRLGAFTEEGSPTVIMDSFKE
ncbi:MAG: glycoside hydrolase family 53 protein [Bacteroidales bacterium]